MTVPLIPARVHVYLSAYVPQPGRALSDRGSEAFGPGFGDSRVRDELGRSYWPDPAAAAHDLQYPAGSATLAGRLRRQARKPSVEPTPLAAHPDTQRAYIVCNRRLRRPARLAATRRARGAGRGADRTRQRPLADADLPRRTGVSSRSPGRKRWRPPTTTQRNSELGAAGAGDRSRRRFSGRLQLELAVDLVDELHVQFEESPHECRHEE